MSPAPGSPLLVSKAKYVLGADECGLGSLAGPLVVCCVACTSRAQSRCKDSKTYGRSRHSSMLRDIDASEWATFSVVTVSADVLCSKGYSGALDFAFQAAVKSVRTKLKVPPEESPVVMDGTSNHKVPVTINYAKADAIDPVVSLASCLGKRAQVKVMDALAAKYPQWGFDLHHGYGSAKHIEAIIQHGVIASVHRIPVIMRMQSVSKHPLKVVHDE